VREGKKMSRGPNKSPRHGSWGKMKTTPAGHDHNWGGQGSKENDGVSPGVRWQNREGRGPSSPCAATLAKFSRRRKSAVVTFKRSKKGGNIADG